METCTKEISWTSATESLPGLIWTQDVCVRFGMTWPPSNWGCCERHRRQWMLLKQRTSAAALPKEPRGFDTGVTGLCFTAHSEALGTSVGERHCQEEENTQTRNGNNDTKCILHTQ